MKTYIFEPRNKCPRCGSKAIYYKREGKRINIVRCDLCTALWKEKSECLAGPGERIGDCGFRGNAIGTIYIRPHNATT